MINKILKNLYTRTTSASPERKMANTKNALLTSIAHKKGRKPLTGQALDAAFSAAKTTASPAVFPSFSNANNIGYDFFIQQASANLFTLQQLSHRNQLLRSLPTTSLPLVISSQPSIQQLNWHTPNVEMQPNCQQPAMAVVEASAGIAETGTVLISSAQVPSALLFLCEELVIVLAANTIVNYQEQLQIPTTLPRAIHQISGPSRTADIEQTLQVGAHGPKSVHLFIVTE